MMRLKLKIELAIKTFKPFNIVSFDKGNVS